MSQNKNISALRKILDKYQQNQSTHSPLLSEVYQQEAMSQTPEASNLLKIVSKYFANEEGRPKEVTDLKLFSNVSHVLSEGVSDENLQLESRCQAKDTHQSHNTKQEINDLPLECLESRMQMKKLKIHSSIDGMDTMKYSIQNKSQKDRSIPLSDLILAENGYEHLFNEINNHQKHSQSDEVDSFHNQYYENLKILKEQTQILIEGAQREMKSRDLDEEIDRVARRICQVQSEVSELRQFRVKAERSPRQKTPQIRKVKSNRYLLNVQKKEQNLENKIKAEREKSLKLSTKLTQVKNHCKVLENKTSEYSEGHNILNPPVTPKSPRSPTPKMSCRVKHVEFLEKEKRKYFQVLKKNKKLIKDSIFTFREFTGERIEQITQEIQVLRDEIKFMDVRFMENNFFASPKRNSGNLSKKKSSSRLGLFANNFSEKLVDTNFKGSPLSPRNVPLSPRYPRTPRQSSPATVYLRAMKSKEVNRAEQSIHTNRSKGKVSKISTKCSEFSNCNEKRPLLNCQLSGKENLPRKSDKKSQRLSSKQPLFSGSSSKSRHILVNVDSNRQSNYKVSDSEGEASNHLNLHTVSQPSQEYFQSSSLENQN